MVLGPEGQTREAQTIVKVTLPPQEDALEDLKVERPTLDIALSPNLQGRYKPKVENLEEVISQPIAIRATRAAKLAYEMQEFPPMTLHILDSDLEKGDEVQERAVVYNFPEEFVRKGEIELIRDTRQPVQAKFTLTRLPASESGSVVGE